MSRASQNPSETSPVSSLYSKTTNSICVSVQVSALLDDCSSVDQIFSFSYTITIKNLGEETVQLLERHWVITSAGNFFDEVVGDGVVGLQPNIEKGESFEYTSGAIIENPFGSMKGSYTMRSASGKFFEVEVPEFELIHPDALH
jgi:ApaG protein